MKMKQILAGVLTAAMVLTSAPVTGLNVSAAETTVIDAPALSMSAEPVMGGQASNSQIIAEGADAGKAAGATTYTDDGYNLTGSTPFLIRFQMKLNAKTNKTGAPGGGSFDTFLSNTCYNMQMNDQYLAFYCNAADNSWPTMQYSISSIDDFIGKWHDIVAVYCDRRFVLFVDGTKAVLRGSTNTQSGQFNLKATGASSISLGVNGFNANFADFAMYTGADNVSGISGSSTIENVNTLLAGKTATAAPIESAGNFVAESTVWTKDGSKVSTFASGTYVGTTKLVAKNGYTFSSEMTMTEGFEGTVSEDGKTMTVTKTVTLVAMDYAQSYLADVQKLLEKNAFSGESTTAVTEAKEALQTEVNNNSEDTVIEEKITALKTAIQEADITMSRRYAEPVVGQAIPMTEDDRLFYDNANSLTVDIAYKFNAAPTETNIAKALFTLSNEKGNYITVWYVPSLSADNNKGAICFVGDGVATGLYFSKDGWGTNDSNWHKISISFSSKNKMLCITKDATEALPWSFTNVPWIQNAWTPMNKLIGTHEWQVEKIQVGKKAENVSYPTIKSDTTPITTVSDVAITDGTPELQIKYIEVSARTYSDANGINGSNSKQDAEIVKERDALVAEKDKVLSTCYTTDTWTAYENACTTASEATTDWAMLNAIDELKTAKKALVKESGFKDVALTLGGKIGVNFRTDDPNAESAEFTMGEKALPSKKTEDANGNTVFICEVAAKEMADTITAVLKNASGNVIDRMEKSVAEYAKGYLTEDSDSSKELQNNLVKSMLHYGAAAQTQFNHNTENLADAGIDAATPSTEGLSNYATYVPSYNGYSAFSLILESDTTLRLYFDNTVSTDSIVVKKQGTSTAVTTETGVKGNRNYVSIPNIAANNLNDVYEITVGGTPAGTCSALAYCHKALNSKQATDSLKNVVKALYQYSTDANAYEASQQSASN